MGACCSTSKNQLNLSFTNPNSIKKNRIPNIRPEFQYKPNGKHTKADSDSIEEIFADNQ